MNEASDSMGAVAGMMILIGIIYLLIPFVILSRLGQIVKLLKRMTRD